MNRPPPLNAIHVFAACARIGSFKLAAEELCVTPGAVSRQVHALEEYLGFKLFDRQHRKVQLTHSGQLYFSQIAPALRTIEGAAENARPTSGRATLQVESTPTFTMHWLIPKLSEFQKCHPDIELQITTSSGPIVLRKDTQIYIRRDPVQFSGLEAEEFMSEVSLLVCSPSYIKKNPLMETKALPVLPLIMIRSRIDLWDKWFKSNNLDINTIKQRIVMDNTILAIQAAAEGLGIALIPSLFIREYLESGELVCVPGSASLNTGSYSLLAPSAHTSNIVDIFSNWIRTSANQET